MKNVLQQQTVAYWKQGAKRSLSLAHDVFAKKYYDHTLFCGHLAIEKLLKARIVDVMNGPAPHSHDLLYLAGLAKLDLTIDQQRFLTEVTGYNIEGRYPEEKLEFHKKITRAVAKNQLEAITDFYLWLSKRKEKF